MTRLTHYLPALAVLLLPALALAQEAAGDAPIASGWDTTLVIWESIGATVLAGLGWLVTKGYLLLRAWLEAKTQNAIALQALAAGERLRQWVHDGVLAVNQTLGEAIRKAKDPNSPGGTAITETEAEALKAAAWDSIKAQAGGWDRMLATAGQILFGGDAGALKAHVDTAIEAELAKVKAAANPPQPRAA